MTTRSMSRATELARRADEARRDRDFTRAAELYRAAIAALSPRAQPEVRLTLWSRAAMCAQHAGALADAEDGLFEAVAVARQHGLSAHLHGLLGRLGVVASERGRAREAAGFHREALAIARELDDVRGMATHLGNLGLLAAARSASDEARRYLKQALAALVSLGDADGAANALNSLGEVERSDGALDAARAAFLEAMDLWERAGSAAGQALAASNLGNLDRVAGRLEDALAYFELALGLSVKAGDVRGQARAHTNLGNVEALRGDREAARRHYEASAALHGGIGFAHGLAVDRVNLASLALEGGALVQAREQYQAALDHFAAAGVPRVRVDLMGLVGQIDARLGRLDAAQEAFVAAREVADAMGYEPALARIDVNLAAVAFARGALERGVAGYLHGAHAFEALAMPAEAITCQLTAADALVAVGRLDAALEVAARAAREAEVRGLGRYRGEAQLMLARLAWERDPTAEARAHVLARAEAMEAEGRPLEALAVRLLVLDRDLEGPRPAWADATFARAEALEAMPMRLDAATVRLAMTAGDADALAAMDDALREAEAAGLVVLALRIERRSGHVLRRGGREGEARARWEAARARALGLGAVAEAERLAALARG